MRFWQRMATAAGLATVAASVVPGVAAATVESYGQCPNNYFCVWENNDGSGHFAKFEWGSPDLSKAIGGYVFNDQISSVWNRTGYTWCLYEHKNFNRDLAGKSWPVGDYMGTSGGPRYHFENIASSLAYCQNP